mmetsp:Transcript_1507/g.9266  ORF Transcript_1507/g.9266 Transcript_1507/m.9266 type:complete len:226 (+) Transcript_1507:3580-4257(+)
MSVHQSFFLHLGVCFESQLFGHLQQFFHDVAIAMDRVTSGRSLRFRDAFLLVSRSLRTVRVRFHVRHRRVGCVVFLATSLVSLDQAFEVDGGQDFVVQLATSELLVGKHVDGILKHDTLRFFVMVDVLFFVDVLFRWLDDVGWHRAGSFPLQGFHGTSCTSAIHLCISTCIHARVYHRWTRVVCVQESIPRSVSIRPSCGFLDEMDVQVVSHVCVCFEFHLQSIE